MSNKAVEALQEYGLIDPDKVIKTSTGNVKGVKPGGVKGQEYLQPGATDPYAWVNNVMIPALAKKGVTDPAKIQEAIAAIASQTTTAQMMSIFATQQSRIEKDKHLVAGAEGASAAERFQRDDPKVIRKSIESQVDNLLGNTAAPFLPAANKGMDWLSSGLSYMSEQAKENPLRAGAGLGWGAAMLGALGIDSTSSAFGVAGNLFRGENAAGGLKFGLTKLTAALAPILDIATRSDILPASEKMKRMAGLHADIFDKLRDADDSDRAAAILGDGDEVYRAQAKARSDAQRAAAERQLSDLGFAAPGTPGRGLLAGQYSIDDIRNATGIGSGSQQPAKAEIVGNATLDATVTVKPSSEFWATVEQKISNAINAFRSTNAPASGSSGSTGQSMPEAGPPH